MKYIFTLLIGAFFTSAAFASNITLNFSGSRSYQVLIDGRAVPMTDYNRNTIYLSDLRPGLHNIQVFRQRRRGWGWNTSSSNILASSTDFRVTPQYDLAITIDDRGRALLTESRCAEDDRGGWNRNDDHAGYDRNDDHGSYDRNDDHGGPVRNDDRGGYGNAPVGPQVTTGVRNDYRAPMADGQFNVLLQQVRNQWTGRLSTTQDALRGNYFTSIQVRQLLQFFPAERDRLDLVKLAYRHLVDKQNFTQLYDLFSYQGQDQLDDFIQSVR